MSLVDYLHDNRTPMELAKELARSAHENAALRDKLGAAELELFWMKAAEREPVAQASAAPAVQTMNDRRFSPAYLMYNCRRLLTGSARTTSNWNIAAELFALGSTSAVKLCRDAGIDPDATTVGRAPLTTTESNKDPQ